MGSRLEVINLFATRVEERFQKIEHDILELKQEQQIIKSEMVTKDFLSDQLADLKGDLVLLIRKEDAQLEMVVTTLHDRNIFTDRDVKQIRSMGSFPKHR
jgi:hypothetical protein